MKLPCPTCSRTIELDHVQPDGTAVCPHCATTFSSVVSSDRDVLNDRERESHNILRLLRYAACILGIVAAIVSVINAPSPPTVVYYGIAATTSLGFLGLATIFFIAEQVLVIKAYVRASTD